MTHFQFRFMSPCLMWNSPLSCIVQKSTEFYPAVCIYEKDLKKIWMNLGFYQLYTEMGPLLYSCPIRKTARNFNQPMCKAAKTTIVEVCMSHQSWFPRCCNIQTDRGIQRDRNVPLKQHAHSVWLELTRVYMVHIFNTITTFLQIYLGLAQPHYKLFFK